MPKDSTKREDTLTEAYALHFYKNYLKILTNYCSYIIGKSVYDKATYKWLNETDVEFILFDSASNKMQKVTLIQHGENACMRIPDEDLKKK